MPRSQSPQGKTQPEDAAGQTASDFAQDNAWKDALDRFFRQFMEFFFPVIAAEIDWSRGYEFLDKELAQITRDHRVRRKLVDKLVKVWLLDGTEKWLLIHLEVQVAARKGFSKRIYIYNYRIFDRYDVEVVSLVLITGGSKSYQEKSYEAKRWGCELTFRFPVVKIVDYEDRWAELEASRNPFALAVMAHLRVRQARGDNEKKYVWKRELIFRLYEKGYSKLEIFAFFRFVDWVIELPKELSRNLSTEIYEYQEKKRMPYISSWERLVMEDATRNLLLNQLEFKIGALDEKTKSRIQKLEQPELDILGKDLFSFSRLQDVKKWLALHTKKKAPGK
ncbi:MAG TPA: DUF4351 domain-containing protein [Blastocatellia bacterium]|nr:DUF4351 domain-containing protein [Blastocatellia bacterium]